MPTFCTAPPVYGPRIRAIRHERSFTSSLWLAPAPSRLRSSGPPALPARVRSGCPRRLLVRVCERRRIRAQSQPRAVLRASRQHLSDRNLLLVCAPVGGEADEGVTRDAAAGCPIPLTGPASWSRERCRIASPHKPPAVSGSCQETTTSTATSFSGGSARNTSADSLVRGLTTGTSRFVDAVPTARGRFGLAVGIAAPPGAFAAPGRTRPGTGSTRQVSLGRGKAAPWRGKRPLR